MPTDPVRTGHRSIPQLDLDPYDEATLQDPYGYYREVRNGGPVAYLKRYGIYVMGRHRDIRAALNDWQTWSSTGGSGVADIRRPDAWRPGSPIVEVDPPRHTEIRRTMQKVLSPKVLAGWREDFLAEAHRLVDAALARGTFDGVDDLSEAFVSTVFPRALGLRPAPGQRENLYILGALNFDSQGPANERYKATRARADSIMDWTAETTRREAMLPGGFGAQVYAAADSGELSAELAPLLIRTFLRGGLDTTSATISATICYLAAHPEQYAMVRSEPALIRNALEEAMRIETPIQYAARQTMREVEIEGMRIPEDSKVLMLLASANRDPEVWENPDLFDVTRRNFDQLALGDGVHRCVGQMVARLEGECLLQALTQKVASLTLAAPAERRLNNNLRSFGKIPLRATSA